MESPPLGRRKLINNVGKGSAGVRERKGFDGTCDLTEDPGGTEADKFNRAGLSLR